MYQIVSNRQAEIKKWKETRWHLTVQGNTFTIHNLQTGYRKDEISFIYEDGKQGIVSAPYTLVEVVP